MRWEAVVAGGSAEGSAKKMRYSLGGGSGSRVGATGSRRYQQVKRSRGTIALASGVGKPYKHDGRIWKQGRMLTTETRIE